ncbi:hypothetical protein [Bradyrhizobium sp. DOA9]|uniref:hypothetical protein n=1 Tax=Bradyrhizobium sp. DOA9 TaxID=1126627 RepID=UPI00046A1AF0|nr:hypothetical protein [Bradyrhizobium sp. DOA9]
MRRIKVLADCAPQITGLAARALIAIYIDPPTPLTLTLAIVIFGTRDGPLSSAVLSTVKPAAAGAASGMYGTTVQIGNAAGVAAIGEAYVAIESAHSSRAAFLVSLALFMTVITICTAFLTWMRRTSASS